MTRAAHITAIVLLGVVLVGWGTSPCLIGAMCTNVMQAAGIADSCCCCDDTPAPDCPEAPVSGTEDCPVCSSIGSMHELPPMGTKVDLDAPAVASLVAAPDAPAPSAAIAVLPNDTPGLEPPRVHFAETVSLQR